MPGLAQRNDQQFRNGDASFHGCTGSAATNGCFWSKHRGDISYNQLQKFWSELSPQARQDLLRIDKQTLFEQARKNMYCSRCNGLLLEGYLQIIMYGKSLQQEGGNTLPPCSRLGGFKNQCYGDLCLRNGCEDDVPEPSVHPWGGLTTTRDGALSLLDCYICTTSLKVLQNVFDSARARERERELLYPDACGGGARGWISQGMVGYGRGHGTREACALHTARLSVDTLVDFWSALGEETRLSLLRMKEEDFIERLMYRFDSKRFCRDCRRNVIREFKELKELKRLRREPRCTSWFCVADAAFQYEVSFDTVQADWNQAFVDTLGTYHHFEWAIGTGEGKSDILEFENVGLSGRVQVNGLDLSNLNACYIMLRAWKMDGRCTELSVKAHAMKGQQCVHCRLVVGDGFVTITRGENIKRFFEHAEEAEEEEDDDSVDKDGNELDGECSRPQKHAKSPELAREFLLDAATVIFKEQVEKAFREGTARQNAHSIFVCLALKLLEERVHVACKDIITLEKQMKLLEEEEKEKREDEERKERKRIKEKEKKQRRKERLREKDKGREKRYSESNPQLADSDGLGEQMRPKLDEDPEDYSCGGTSEAISSSPLSSDVQPELLIGDLNSNQLSNSDDGPDGDTGSVDDGNDLIAVENLRYSRRITKFQKAFAPESNLRWSDRRRYVESASTLTSYERRDHGERLEMMRNINGLNKQSKSNAPRSGVGTAGVNSEKFQSFSIRTNDRYDSRACSCNQQIEYRTKVEESHMARVSHEMKTVSKSERTSDNSKSYYRGSKYNQVEYPRENCGRPKLKTISGHSSQSRESTIIKKVWEPMELQRKYPRSNSDTDVTLRPTLKIDAETSNHAEATGASNSCKVPQTFGNKDNDELVQELGKCAASDNICQTEFQIEASQKSVKEEVLIKADPFVMNRASFQGTLDSSVSSSSTSDNCSSSCLSEGDSNTSSSNPQNPESSSTSDSEDIGQTLEGRETSVCIQNGYNVCCESGMKQLHSTDIREDVKAMIEDNTRNYPAKSVQNCDNENGKTGVGNQAQGCPLPPLHNQSMQFPVFAPSVGYYYQSPVSWSAGPAISFPHPNHYVFASPYGYGLIGNARYMHYNQLTPPLLNPSHLPVLQPIAQTNGFNWKGNSKIASPDQSKEAHQDAKVQKTSPSGQQSTELPKAALSGLNEKSDRYDVGDSGFSLFHFGGDPGSLKEGIVGNISPNMSVDHTEVDRPCNKKDSMEEYNLFAASNGIKFSFF